MQHPDQHAGIRPQTPSQEPAKDGDPLRSDGCSDGLSAGLSGNLMTAWESMTTRSG